MNIVMLGAPGAGKGTISAEMKVDYNLPHISSGDIFRENIKNETELGIKVKKYIDKGELVPDDLTINLVVDTLKQDRCKNGFILDGFPRTIPQAIGLDEELSKSGKKIDLVLLVEADEDKLIKRLLGRRVCEKCGATYHLVNMPPKVADTCDKCGSKIIQRKDDTEEVITDRLKTYNNQTKPLIDYYKDKNVLKTISGFIDNKEDRMREIDKIIKGVKA